MRVVSLLPSTTEILFAIGAGDDVAGVTVDCDYPHAARTRPVVSLPTLPEGLSAGEIDREVRARLDAGADLYRLDEGVLRDLAPDVVVTQDLCAVCAVDVDGVDAALAHLGCTADVITIDPQTLPEVLDSVETVGAATGREEAAARLASSLRDRVDGVRAAVSGRTAPAVAVLEWTDPPFTAGHWVPGMVVAAGGTPSLGKPGARSVATTWDEVAAGDPDLIVVAPCGYHLDGAVELAEAAVAAGHLPARVPVWAVDADAAFVRPGPRLVDGVEALAAICHPEALPPRADLARCVRP
ncbi:MAG: ABC transporter substrate-binding protein [Streptosporangiales bacterium]